MKIAMITSESLPFSKTGGLGDVVFPLSKALAMLNHDVKLFIPSLKGNITKETRFLCAIKNDENILANLYEFQPISELPKFKIYLIEEETLITQKKVYGENNKAYPYNASRFALFSRLVYRL